MKNPYEVLGVSENASDEEIKKAYHKLAQQYHPDRYVDNPLASLAEEKLKEINEAYDTITKMRAGGGRQSSSYGSSYGGAQGNTYNQSYTNAYSGQSRSANPAYAQIRNLIMQHREDQALSQLDAMTDHDAEWFFLKGVAYYQKGWFDQAVAHANTAVRMDPRNREYAEFVSRISMQNRNYRTAGMGGMGGDSACDCCLKLWCADSCCECMGGDLCPCC